MNDTMTTLTLTIDGHAVTVAQGQTVLDAARQLGLEIPTLCFLEKCGPLTSCQVCLVKINGKLVPSCGTRVQQDMVVESETDEVHEARRTALELLFSDHVGDCLAPCHRLCPLGMNIPVMLRHIQAGQLEAAGATVRESLPLPAVLGRLCHHPCEQGCRRGTWDAPAGIRELERFVADRGTRAGSGSEPSGGTGDPPKAALPSRKPPTGKSVAIIGAGPAGLAAAYYLLRQGHACTVVDRHESAGGTLRQQVEEKKLPREALEAEIEQIQRLGAQFKLAVSLGRDLTLDGLARGFDAVLITAGEITKEEGEALGLEMAPGGIQIQAETFRTSRHAVFAAGRATKPVAQLVRAMAEGQAAAGCIHQFLSGHEIRRPDRPFSSIMGRLEKDELKQFIPTAAAPAAAPCDACAGFTTQEQAVSQASRCLHCDCPSSGHCALQHYAQTYGADASRFHQQRRHFERYEQPGGVTFEPGKCIRCGICVKLTELGGEPLGLAFIGRGFQAHIAAPFNHPFEEGLLRTAEECVRHCPTGALVHRTELYPSFQPAGERNTRLDAR
jgi:ferredoxin